MSEQPKKSKTWLIVGIAAAAMLLGCCIIGAIISALNPSSDTPGQAAVEMNTEAPVQPQPTSTQPQTETIAEPTIPADPYQSLVAAITEALGSSNRDVDRVTSIEHDEDIGQITVTWAINDNLTTDFIKVGAQTDAVDIIEKVDSSGLQYNLLSIHGTFALVDDFGNVTEDTVVYASYSAQTIDKINWENFLYTSVWDIADTSDIRPEFR
ncbi:MAG: hypothetical protein JXB07_19080 [Anaerolineae bacterium]|nr:hypothetical protein [Anaerolineae bacterium]